MTRKEALEAVAREARRFCVVPSDVVRSSRDLEQAIADLDALPPYPPRGAVKVRVAVCMERSGEYHALGAAWDGTQPNDVELLDDARSQLSKTAKHVGWLVGYFVPPAGAPEVEGEEEAP